MLDRAVTVNPCVSFTAPEPIPDSATACSPACSISDTFGSDASVGASFTPVISTVTTAASESSVPSFTRNAKLSYPALKLSGSGT